MRLTLLHQYASLLYRHRDIISDPIALEAEGRNPKVPNPNVGSILFLIQAYQPKYYFWEVIECARRLLLASIIGIVSDNAAAAPSLGLLITVFFSAVFEYNRLHYHQRIFKDANVDTLSILLQFSLTLIFTAALMIKVDVSSEDRQDQKVYSWILIVILFQGPFLLLLLELRAGFKMLCDDASHMRNCCFEPNRSSRGSDPAFRVDTDSSTTENRLTDNAAEVPRPRHTSQRPDRLGSVDRPPLLLRTRKSRDPLTLNTGSEHRAPDKTAAGITGSIASENSDGGSDLSTFESEPYAELFTSPQSLLKSTRKGETSFESRKLVE